MSNHMNHSFHVDLSSQKTEGAQFLGKEMTQKTVLWLVFLQIPLLFGGKNSFSHHLGTWSSYALLSGSFVHTEQPLKSSYRSFKILVSDARGKLFPVIF